MHILRTRIGKDIICEFLPPIRRTLSVKPKNNVIILCGGMPAYPGKSGLPEFLAEQGYWVFVPRYRGSWESGGKLLAVSPHQDVIDIIDQLPKGFRDIWSGKTYKIPQAEVYLIGSSFGGAAVILASRDAYVKKAVALSPVIDWRVETKTEPINKLRMFTKEAFGEAYRFNEEDWKKLKGGKFYNPMHEAATIDGNKLLILHSKDDKTVYARTSASFSKMTGAKLILLNKGGHLSISQAAAPKIWKEVKKFFG